MRAGPLPRVVACLALCGAAAGFISCKLPSTITTIPPASGTPRS